MNLDSKLLCPNCAEVLMVLERAGVEVDICPKCRGVWLDRGELEKILENVKSLEVAPIPPTRQQQAPPQPVYEDRHEKRRYRDDDDDDDGRRGRRGGVFDFLGDIFD